MLDGGKVIVVDECVLHILLDNRLHVRGWEQASRTSCVCCAFFALYTPCSFGIDCATPGSPLDDDGCCVAELTLRIIFNIY